MGFRPISVIKFFRVPARQTSNRCGVGVPKWGCCPPRWEDWRARFARGSTYHFGCFTFAWQASISNRLCFGASFFYLFFSRIFFGLFPASLACCRQALCEHPLTTNTTTIITRFAFIVHGSRNPLRRRTID